MRYLGLDVGRKSIGVAVGETLASELTTIRANGNEEFYTEPGKSRVCQELEKIIRAEEIDAIVVGLPVSEAGQPTEESKLIETFSRDLEAKLNLTVHFVDETLTSFMAEEMLESQGLDKKEASERVHQLAAELILQQYLEEYENA